MARGQEIACRLPISFFRVFRLTLARICHGISSGLRGDSGNSGSNPSARSNPSTWSKIQARGAYLSVCPKSLEKVEKGNGGSGESLSGSLLLRNRLLRWRLPPSPALSLGGGRDDRGVRGARGRSTGVFGACFSPLRRPWGKGKQ